MSGSGIPRRVTVTASAIQQHSTSLPLCSSCCQHGASTNVKQLLQLVPMLQCDNTQLHDFTAELLVCNNYAATASREHYLSSVRHCTMPPSPQIVVLRDRDQCAVVPWEEFGTLGIAAMDARVRRHAHALQAHNLVNIV